jgi:hypothetical protein
MPVAVIQNRAQVLRGPKELLLVCKETGLMQQVRGILYSDAERHISIDQQRDIPPRA